MASSSTHRDYLIKGMIYAAQGQRVHPDITPIEALCRHAEERADILKPSTIRLYRRQYGTAAVALGQEAGLGRDELKGALVRIWNALNAVKGKPSEPRTSTKKVKDPRDWMVKEVVGHLKLMAVRHHRIRSAACALYCLLVPKLGTRPVELTKAWVDGDVLFVPSAKQAEDQDSVRGIDISDFHPTHRKALLALIYIVDRDVEAGGYDAWLKRLAETLARACETVSRKTGQSIPRLSPSSFRHTAISTWHAAGYTAEEIAELVGHRHLRSQNAYKRSSSAWRMTAGLAKPAEKEPLIGLNEPTAGQISPSLPDEVPNKTADMPGPLMDLDDMPQPQAKSVSDSDTGADIWAAARQKLQSKFDQINRKAGDEAKGGPPSGPTIRPNDG